MNNLAIVLKKKRDDEARLARTSPQTTFNDDGTDQSWGGGSAYTLPQATETTLGGIRAAAKNTESAEVKIGTDGKLYAPASGGSSVDADWEPLTNGDATTPELLFYDGDVVMGRI